MKCTECGMELKEGFAVCEGCDQPEECAHGYSPLDKPPCSICNTRHSNGSTCQIETLERHLKSTQSELDLLRIELGCWTQFGQAVAKELGCLVSYIDPRPSHGNGHIILALVALKNQLEAIKARNVINAIKQICPECGHTLDENDECANCWKTDCEATHAEFTPIYSALTCFLKDWKDGDFTLPRLAEIHAEKLRELVSRE
jgi:hypothetical protein